MNDIKHHQDEGVSTQSFYEGVIKFYIAAVKKHLKVFNFKSKVFQALSDLDPCMSQSMPQSTFDSIEQSIPVTLNKTAVKLKCCEFILDSDVLPEEECDVVNFWLKISQVHSPMGELSITI